MKRFFTDYPIVELGDMPGESAPIREIEAGYSFDGEKYVRVLVGGHREGKILVGAAQVSLEYFYIFHKVGEHYVPMTYNETSAIFKD